MRKARNPVVMARLLSGPFPRFDITRNHAEARMRARAHDACQCRQPLAVAHGELRAQVPPFVIELATRHGDRCALPAFADFAAIESVTASRGFGLHVRQVCSDGGGGIPLHAETFELRVMPVAARFTA